MRCQLSSEPATPFSSVPFWVMLTVIWTDLSLTVTGIVLGMGVEANPFFVWFTQNGVAAMLAGILIYIVILMVWFSYIPDFMRAITAGFLITIHIWGTLSWVRLWIEPVDQLFGVFYLMVGAALLGTVFTAWILLDLKTCVQTPRLTWEESEDQRVTQL